MKTEDLINLYKEDVQLRTVAEHLREGSAQIQLKGLSGSSDAIIASTLFKLRPSTHVLILHDREEAAYFHSDIQNFFPEKEVLFFPTSYKKPYQFEEVENANILQRAEVLNRLNQKDKKGEIIITYPEALYEKVINKKSLVKNTFGVKFGDTLDTNFVTELLIEYGFELTDFVYEAGQFTIRGGIVDIFSYANELPYRIELFGNEVESIRTFDPNTQLSIETKKAISIIPDVQTKLLEETRQSFFEFLNKKAIIWFKDKAHTSEVIDSYFQKVVAQFNEIVKSIGEDNKVIYSPESLFDDATTFEKSAEGYPLIEFGSRFYLKTDNTYTFKIKPQPSFNKDFHLVADTVSSYVEREYKCFLASDSLKQQERTRNILEEVQAGLSLEPLHIGLREGFVDEENHILCFTEHQIYERYFKYKTKEKYSKSKSITIKELKNLHPGDYVTHIDYGIGRFGGMEKVEVNGKLQEAIRLIYKDDDLLYVSVQSLHKIAKHSGQDGTAPPISKLGSPEWENKKKKVKKKVKEIAINLISLYAKRKAARGFEFSADNYLQIELESSFIYEDTPDQAKATEAVKADMELPHPMDRLVCGDVGFGKTEVAIRAAFKAACDGKQVAVLVPTTVLAMQHYKTFKNRMENLPITVDYINRFRSASDTKDILKKVAEGKIDILIGTHKLVSKSVKFKDIGLLIIDEEQKFGVATKEKLKDIAHNVDVLTLTATPIPRTLQFSLMGARDLSIISTPPPNRQPVTTELQVFNEEIIRDAISYELKRGGQVFFVHNRVNDIEQIGNIILRLVPDARIGIAHGQMDGSKLEKAMIKFIDGDYDVLVSTNIIESGLDIPNSNTIIINNSHMYGMSDLHQMRGRVGRSNKKAFCYLLTPPLMGLSSDARKRLQTLEEFTDLGDGFKIAMRDLDIRGAGNILGGEQSGFINDIGFETYHKILNETIQELKETEFKDLFKAEINTKVLATECNIESDFQVLIPEEYVTNISERLRLYNQLDNTKDESSLQDFKKEITDRFGQPPSDVEDLIEMVRLRWEAEKLGFEKLIIKNEIMKAYVTIENNDKYFQSPVFGKVLMFIQQHPKKCNIKEHKNKMIIRFQHIQTIQGSITCLTEIQK